MLSRRLFLCAGLSCLGLPLIATAEQKLEFGDYLVHYIALPTSELTPATAKAYGVERSARRGIVVLNVQHRERPQIGLPATISGEVRNLLGQTKTRQFREIREQNAIYTIGEFSFSNLETLSFRFDIRPQGSTQQTELRFAQQFYINRE